MVLTVFHTLHVLFFHKMYVTAASFCKALITLNNLLNIYLVQLLSSVVRLMFQYSWDDSFHVFQ